jgi:hypothetical protein
MDLYKTKCLSAELWTSFFQSKLMNRYNWIRFAGISSSLNISARKLIVFSKNVSSEKSGPKKYRNVYTT